MPKTHFRLSAAAALLTLAACNGPADLAEHDYRQHYPVAVANHTAVAVVSRPKAGQPLAAGDSAQLEQLAKEHLRRGAGPVIITVAAAAADAQAEADARAFADKVAAATGLPAGETKIEVKVGTAQTPNTALVEAPIWVAEIPECEGFKDNIFPDWRNNTSPNFGCATQRNFGLMVQDPADLVRMRESSGRDGNRAADVIGKYEKGSATSSSSETAAPPPSTGGGQ